MSRTRKSIGAAMLALITVTVVGACDDSEFPTSPGQPDNELAAMTDAIQDEFLAENTYLRVLADFGRVLPFQNIVYAEQRHSEAIAYLFIKRGVEVPVSEWDINNVPVFTTLQAACAAGVQAEEDNIALYDELLELTLPADVKEVFTNNRAASLNNHLPSFQACS